MVSVPVSMKTTTTTQSMHTRGTGRHSRVCVSPQRRVFTRSVNQRFLVAYNTHSPRTDSSASVPHTLNQTSGQRILTKGRIAGGRIFGLQTFRRQDVSTTDVLTTNMLIDRRFADTGRTFRRHILDVSTTNMCVTVELLK